MSLLDDLRARSELFEAEAVAVRDALREDIDQAGGPKVIAGLFERKLSTVYGWSEAREAGNKFADCARLAKLAGSESRLVRMLCRLAGGTFVAHEASDIAAKMGNTETVLRWACNVFENAAELARHLRESMADGVLDAKERETLLLKVEHLDEVVEALRLLAEGVRR